MDASKLEAALNARLPGFEALLAVERLSAGASRETYRLAVRVEGRERLLALRRSADDEGSVLSQGPGLAGEARLFHAAHASGVPGPQVAMMLAPEDDLGAGFVMEWIAGETLGARIAKSPAFAAVRPRLARQCGEILARLHRIDLSDEGLSDRLERLTPEACVRRTHEAYLALDAPEPVIDFTAQWLLGHLPPERPLTLVHSDFRNGNLIVSPETGVTAVLDWELAHIGDPMRDLGWLCTRSWRFGVADKPVGGFGAYDELFAGYEAAAGGVVDRQAVFFWEVFGSFWWSVSTLAMAQSWRDGRETSVERPAIGRRSSECQIDCVNLIIPGPAHAPTAKRRSLSAASLPRTDELVASVARFLAGELGAELAGRNAFLSRVAANSLETVGRELVFGADAEARERSHLRGLAGEAQALAASSEGGELIGLRRWLCGALRTGAIGLQSADLHAYLRDAALAQILIDQPAYPGAVEALRRSVPPDRD